jgi:pyrroloquinoline quinone (PQQ) biosynthesis protein C
MGFFRDLNAATLDDQEALLALPFVRRAIDGALSAQAYRAFLEQAFHHVRHTVPLLMATGAALRPTQEWLRPAIANYVGEELGHEEWILDDIAEAGGDQDRARISSPRLPAEVLVAYAYDVVHRRNPLGFFGMVHVLEGTSVRGASRAASNLERTLALPHAAFTYLESHGALDVDHVHFFESLMDQVTDPVDQAAVVHCAHAFYKLYGDVFRDLERFLDRESER